MAKARRHEITLIVRTNRPITRKQAIYTAWNHVQDYTIYGGGKEDQIEPYDEGALKVKGAPRHV